MIHDPALNQFYNAGRCHLLGREGTWYNNNISSISAPAPFSSVRGLLRFTNKSPFQEPPYLLGLCYSLWNRCHACSSFLLCSAIARHARFHCSGSLMFLAKLLTTEFVTGWLKFYKSSDITQFEGFFNYKSSEVLAQIGSFTPVTSWTTSQLKNSSTGFYTGRSGWRHKDSRRCVVMATFVFFRTFQCNSMKQVPRRYTLNLHVIVLTENVCVYKFICILHAPSFKSFVTPPCRGGTRVFWMQVLRGCYITDWTSWANNSKYDQNRLLFFIWIIKSLSRFYNILLHGYSTHHIFLGHSLWR